MKAIWRALLLLSMISLCNICVAAGKPQPLALTPRATVNDVAKELVCNCPDCGKQALDQCEHCDVSRKFKAIIAKQIKDGKSKDQILAFIGDNYGEVMLGNPRPVGFNRIATIVPPVAALLGFGLLALYLARRRKRARNVPLPTATGTTGPKNDDPRVAAALREIDY